MKIVIRAGGIGSRLWPMSRKNNPKQFQNVIGEKSMLRVTYERVRGLSDSNNDIFISINKDFIDRAEKEIPEIEAKQFIIETDTRNTGPAMCLEVCYLEEFSDKDEVIASLPSDDFISDNSAFRQLLESSESFINEHPDYILTPAIRPEYIDTGYSYFKAGKNLQKNSKDAIYRVADIAEKPNYEHCEELIKSGVYYCHTGMYLWKLEHIANLFKAHQKEMYETCREVVRLSLKEDFAQAEKLYSQLEKVSIESAITDKTDKIAMSVSNQIGWSDLGKWHIIKQMLKPNREDNLLKGDIITREAKNNLVYSSVQRKIVVINDVEDLAIVDTGDVLFVSSLKNSAEVKKVVEQLKEEGREEYL